MFGVKDKVLLKKRQGLFIQRTGLLKGITTVSYTHLTLPTN